MERFAPTRSLPKDTSPNRLDRWLWAWLLAGLLTGFPLGFPGPVLAGELRIETLALRADGTPHPEASLEALPVPDNFAMQNTLLQRKLPEATLRAHGDLEGRLSMDLPRPGLWRIIVRAEGFVAMQIPTLAVAEPLVLPPVRLRRALEAKWLLQEGEAALSRRQLPGTLAVYAESAEPTYWKGPLGGAWQPALRISWAKPPGPIRLDRGPGEELDLLIHRPLACRPQQTTELRDRRILLEPHFTAPLTVRVQDSTGQPIQGAVLASRHRPWPLGSTDSQGRLTLKCSPGTSLGVVIFTPEGAVHGANLLPGRENLLRVPPVLRVPGRVVDPSGKPISEALLWPPGNPAAARITDSQGRFELLHRPAAEIRLEARHSRFQPRRFEAAAESERAPLRLVLQPAVSIEGHIRNADGEPLATAQISAWPEGSPGTSKIPRDGATSRASSGAGGEFRLSGLSPGETYQLKVSKEGLGGVEIPVAAPSKSGEQRPLEVFLPSGRTGTGQVLDLDESPIAGARLELRRSGAGEASETESGSLEASTGPEGRFRFVGIGAGSVDLVARAPGFAPMVVRGIRLPPGLRPVDLGTLLLEPGGQISGQVVSGDGLPIAGAIVRYLDPLRATRARIPHEERHPLPEARADQEGVFHLPDLPASQVVRLRFEAPGFQPRQLDGVSPKGEFLSVTLRPAARVQGLVMSSTGDPITEAKVFFHTSRPQTPGASQELREGSAETDEKGRFVAENLCPGDILVQVWADGYVPAPGRRIRVAEGGISPLLRFELERGLELRGILWDEEGEPVEGATVQSKAAGVESEGDGSFTLRGLPPGIQEIQVLHPRYNPWKGKVEIEDESPLLEISLEAGSLLAGRAVDAEGLPLGGVEIHLSRLEGPAAPSLRTLSGPDGAFSFPAVSRGRYEIRGSLSGYTPKRPLPVVVLRGEPMEGVEVQLQAGIRVEGRILGLGFEDLGQARVRAEALGGSGLQHVSTAGEIDFEGRFRIDHLAPGDYLLTATTASRDREATARIRLEPGSVTEQKDLEFQEGLVLSGQILAGGEAVPGTEISLRNMERLTSRTVRGDYEGRFHIADLPPGRFLIELSNPRYGLADNRELELTGDREILIDLELGGLRGEVLGSPGDAPVPGAQVVLRQLLEDGSQASTFAASSDADGRFQLERLPQGSYRLQVQENGYIPIDELVAVGPGNEELRILLEPTLGLELDVRLASGDPPRFVSLSGISRAGQAFQATRQYSGGLLRFSTLPPGRWSLLVGGPGGAAVRIETQVPGAPHSLTLPAAGNLRVRVPELLEEEGIATLTLTSAAGEPFLSLPTGGPVRQEWPVTSGHATVEGIPAGSWSLKVRTMDGRVLQKTAITTGGPDIEVSLP